MYRSLELRTSTIPLTSPGSCVLLACAAGWKFLERKIRLKIFGACVDFAIAIATTFFAIFPEKEIAYGRAARTDTGLCILD